MHMVTDCCIIICYEMIILSWQLHPSPLMELQVLVIVAMEVMEQGCCLITLDKGGFRS